MYYPLFFFIVVKCRHCHTEYNVITIGKYLRKICCGSGCPLSPEMDERVCHTCLYDPYSCVFSCGDCRTNRKNCGKHGTGCRLTCTTCSEHQFGLCGYFGDEVYHTLPPRDLLVGDYRYRYSFVFCSNNVRCPVHPTCT